MPRMMSWIMTTAQPGSLRGPGSRPWQVPLGAMGVRRSHSQSASGPCPFLPWRRLYVSPGMAVTEHLCQSSESTPSPGSTGFSSLSQNPPLLPKCLRGREVLTLAVGGFCPLSLSQVVWNQSQKCEDTLGEGVPEGPHRHKFKRCPVYSVLCLCMERGISFLVSVVQMKSGYWKRSASSPFQSALGRRICCMEPLILELGLDLCLAGS